MPLPGLYATDLLTCEYKDPSINVYRQLPSSDAGGACGATGISIYCEWGCKIGKMSGAFLYKSKHISNLRLSKSNPRCSIKKKRVYVHKRFVQHNSYLLIIPKPWKQVSIKRKIY